MEAYVEDCALWSTMKADKEPENYEEVLASLASKISARPARLADIRQWERRASLWFTLYASAAWGIYIALWYARLVPQATSKHPLERVLAGAPVLTGPRCTFKPAATVSKLIMLLGTPQHQPPPVQTTPVSYG
ncbi:hypothetical protein AURDEDRAFT_178358 [Auricularia subglabra TFB-10046 SS5]|uniref:Uncharacterized protein n=1 Tax=Auricularia subglabra (strain TFB-10046 / SS5) TaxID=717982 RepID=J0WJU8_AURST|nr:hypothetical protein AURDEDRAFT_178358 [Auricularia subglabra TFB-10046 SS5]